MFIISVLILFQEKCSYHSSFLKYMWNIDLHSQYYANKWNPVHFPIKKFPEQLKESYVKTI